MVTSLRQKNVADNCEVQRNLRMLNEKLFFFFFVCLQSTVTIRASEHTAMRYPMIILLEFHFGGSFLT